jgi:mutator protein MutT
MRAADAAAYAPMARRDLSRSSPERRLMAISEYVRRLRERVGPELLLLPGVVAVIRDDRGRVLVQRRRDDGRWGLPAGAIDPGETPAEALVREVREETGLEVRPERVLAVYGGPMLRHHYPNGDEAEYLAVVFACIVMGGALRPVDGESLELQWVAQDDLPALGLVYPGSLFAHATPEALFDPPRVAPG